MGKPVNNVDFDKGRYKNANARAKKSIVKSINPHICFTFYQ